MARAFTAASSHYVSVDAAVVSPPFTAGLWFRTTSTASDQVLLFMGDKDVANQRHQLYLDSGGGAVLNYLIHGGGSSVNCRTTGSYSANTWHLAVMVNESATSRSCYLDGGNVATSGTSVTVTGADRTSIGLRRSSSPGVGMNGLLDRVFFYNAALTADEIAALYRVGSPLSVRREALVDYRKLGYFDPEPNWVAPGNTMTVNGATRDYGTPGVWERRWMRAMMPWIEAAGGVTFTQNLSGSVGSSGAVPKRTDRLLAGAI